MANYSGSGEASLIDKFSNPRFNIVHQNIRSIRKNFDILLANLATLPVAPNIIFLTEVWIETVEMDNYKINGYKIFGNCNLNYRAGGVLVYIQETLHPSIKHHKLVSADMIEVVVGIDAKVLSFLCVYRLQNAATPEFFVTELNSILANISYRNFFVLGDLNINILDCPQKADQYLYMMGSYGLESLVNVITRPSSRTCLDHAFFRLSSNSSLHANATVYDYRITDHSLVSINIYGLQEITKVSSNDIHYKQLIKYESLCKILNSESWTPVYQQANACDAYEQFTNILAKHIEANMDIKSYRQHNSLKMLKPWITQALCKEIAYKNRLSKKSARHPHNQKLKDMVVALTRTVKLKVEEAKSLYYLSRFNSCGKNIKKTWQLVNDLLTKGQKSQDISSIIDTNNDLVTVADRIPDVFNKHFLNVASYLNHQSHNSNNHSHSFIANISETNSFFFTPTTTDEILSVIKSLKNSNSAGFDKFSNNLIKKISVYIVGVLEYIINLSLATGVVPIKLKTAIVVPIYKNGDTENLNNYRPISLLPSFSKVLEKIVKKRMMLFLNKNKFLHDSQYGFREGMGTETALLNFVKSVYEGMDGGNVVASIFVDLVKAFDMVDHEILLEKLYNCGFRGVAYDFFKCYLTNRSQYVRIKGNFSCKGSITAGVPQGSVLGPILFLIYLNSIFSLQLNCAVFAFADDMALLYRATSKHVCSTMINEDLKLISAWFNRHKMRLSAKTKAMVFSTTPSSISDLNAVYHSTRCSNNCDEDCMIIQEVNTFKYLGLVIDNNLNWGPLIDNIRKYMLYTIRKLYMLKPTCPKPVLLNVFNALVQSKLSYGVVCWGGTYPSRLSSIIIAQKHALRIVYNKRRIVSAWPLFVESGSFPLNHLYIYRTLRLFFKMSGNWSNHVPTYNLRAQHRFRIQKFNTTLFKRSFLILAPSIFNKLPDYLRRCTITNDFLSQLRAYLFEHKNLDFLLHFVI